jgi:outer membrane protein OmpA-like peptidoglycan-associated protein
MSSSLVEEARRASKARHAVQKDPLQSARQQAHNLQRDGLMSAVRIGVALGAVVIVAASMPTTAVAQTPGSVRVVEGQARIQRWYKAGLTDVLMRVDPGTTLEVLDEENGWYWVITPPTAHGTRMGGWIRARDVEPMVTLRAPRADASDATPSPNAADADASLLLAALEEDKVTITPRRDEGAAGAPKPAYTFEDVHFDRDRHMLRSEDMSQLQAAVAALKADPSLSVNLEGYTCNLGSPAYNLALGARRANAVKDYLISQGIAGDRLHTVSFGEDHSKHDNSREETRRLNRRVAVVPTVKR